MEHPLRQVAVTMMMDGEATPSELASLLRVSQQRVYYWAKTAKIAGKMAAARRTRLLARLMRDQQKPDGPEPERGEIQEIRKRLVKPRGNREQVAKAKADKAKRAANHRKAADSASY